MCAPNLHIEYWNDQSVDVYEYYERIGRLSMLGNIYCFPVTWNPSRKIENCIQIR